jgi:uncharacterized membrane protein
MQTQDETFERDFKTRPVRRPGYAKASSRARARAAIEPVDRRAKGAGLIGLGLGLVRLCAPRLVARAIGAPTDLGSRALIVATGIRDISLSVGVLAQMNPATMMWLRVAGDLADLALLGRSRAKGRAFAAGATLLGVTALDVVSAVDLTRRHRQIVSERGGMRVCKAITIHRSPEEVYRFWRDLANLPQFMSHLATVEMRGQRSHWRSKAPFGTTVTWDADLLFDRPNELIAWHSTLESAVTNEGWVRFEPYRGGRDTVVRVELHFEPAGGVLGETMAKLFGADPHETLSRDLRNLKQVLETGEILHSDASIHEGPHPGRPPRSFDGERQVMS